jgi:hypothetical protein
MDKCCKETGFRNRMNGFYKYLNKIINPIYCFNKMFDCRLTSYFKEYPSQLKKYELSMRLSQPVNNTPFEINFLQIKRPFLGQACSCQAYNFKTNDYSLKSSLFGALQVGISSTKETILLVVRKTRNTMVCSSWS